jgi:hypothetical protein
MVSQNVIPGDLLMSFDRNIWLLDQSVTSEEIKDASRPDGSLDGINLASILISKGSLERELDYFAVQTTMREGALHTLGLTSEGTFMWFPDTAGLGGMDTAHNDATRNAQVLNSAFDPTEEPETASALRL